MSFAIQTQAADSFPRKEIGVAGRPAPEPAGSAVGGRASLFARRSQAGYALLIILVMLAMLVLMLARAVPAWKTQIQRDREDESITRAKEYVTGIKRYYHKFGSYPPNLDRLEATNGMLFLRRAWVDPITGGNYQLIHYGQAQATEIVNYYGRVGTTATGAGSATGTASATGTGSSTGDTGAPGGAGANASPFGGLTGGAPGGSGSAFGGSSGFGSSGSFGGIGMGVPGGPPPGGQTEPTSGVGAAGGQAGTQASGGSSGAAAGSFLGISDDGSQTANGQTLGGGPIIGVASTSQKVAIHVFNNFNIPNKWQFVYDPMQDQSMTSGVGAAPAAASGSGSGTSTSPPPFGIGH